MRRDRKITPYFFRSSVFDVISMTVSSKGTRGAKIIPKTIGCRCAERYNPGA